MYHVVFFWMKQDLEAEAFKGFEAELKQLTKIDRVNEGWAGTPAPTEMRPVTDHSFHYSLILHFNTVEDHNAYQAHPEHEAFVERCQDLWERVLVYDAQMFPDW